jgi:hypothetical protein
MEVCKLYDKYFPVNRIIPLLVWNFNKSIFKHFFGKAVQDKKLSRSLEINSLLNYNTFNISPGKQAYLCCMNELWASRLKFLARTNCLPLNERLSKINLRESSKCNICDDDIVEDLHHFLLQNLKLYQTGTIQRNRSSNKLVLSGSRVFRVTALSKAAVLDRRLLS